MTPSRSATRSSSWGNSTAYRWPADDLSALADQAGFAEVGRMSREPRDGERFRRGHLLLRQGTAVR